MQSLSEIRELLDSEGLRTQKQFGQNFLIDLNLMRKLLELAELTGDQSVLEVGAGTGSLTEELLDVAQRVITVEIDHGLARLLRRRLSDRENLVLLECDILASKHAISPSVLELLPHRVQLVSNLPYNIATPLISQCLLDSWSALNSGSGAAHIFERMTFTVQRDLAEKLTASPGNKQYGPLSVIVSLLGKVKMGPAVPAAAFWPRPRVTSRIVRIDFADDAAGKILDADLLKKLLTAAFGHRRKQLKWMVHHAEMPCDVELLAFAMDRCGVSATDRAERVSPLQFLAVANMLAESQ